MNNFQQIKTGLSITNISQDTIDRIARIKAFNDSEMNNILYDHHKELLRISMNKNSNKEVGLFWNLNDKYSKPLMILGETNGFNIKSDAEISSMVNTPYNLMSVVVMHNHPRNGMFSGVDIRSFIDFDSIYLMTAVCNDGTIYMLRKERAFQPFLMEQYYNDGVEQSRKAVQREQAQKARKLKLDINNPDDTDKIAKIKTKSYYYGIKNIAKHAKEIGVTYRCSVRRK